MYAYCLNNPVCKVDYAGKAPGDLFENVDNAAEDFANYINSKSISENLEYSSYIYRMRVKIESTHKIRMPKWFAKLTGRAYITIKKTVCEYRYYYKEPQAGDVASANPSVVGLIGAVGIAHTHGAYDPRYKSDIFSDGDKTVADVLSILVYVATPIGKLLKYDPSDQSETIISMDIPYDENHPGRGE